jgi:hypothetical protein
VCFRGGDVSVREFRERGAEAFAVVSGALGSARASAEVGRDFDSGAPVVRGRLSLSSAVMNRSSKLRLVVPILVVPGSAISGTVILSGERETGKVGLTGGGGVCWGRSGRLAFRFCGNSLCFDRGHAAAEVVFGDKFLVPRLSRCSRCDTCFCQLTGSQSRCSNCRRIGPRKRLHGRGATV